MMTEQTIDRQPIYLVRIHATGMPRAVFTQDFMNMLEQIFCQMHPHGFPQFVRSPFLHHRLVWDEDLSITVYPFDDFSTFETNLPTYITERMTFPHMSFPNAELILQILPDPNVSRNIRPEERGRIAWVIASMILERIVPYLPA
jgi:hypothetical protein